MGISQVEGLIYEKKTLDEMLKIIQNQDEQMKKIRYDQLEELGNQKLLINEIIKMCKTQGEILNKLLTDEEKRKIQIKKKMKIS